MTTMKPAICSKVKKSVAHYLRDQVETSVFSGYCVVTLPIKSLDGRWMSVLVEEKFEDQFLVHDGGKTDSELFGQGQKMSESDLTVQAAIAAKFGVTIADGMIQMLSRGSGLSEAIMAVAQTAAMLTGQLVWPAVEVEEQRLQKRVGQALSLWNPDYLRIEQNVEIKGAADIHSFNFIGYAQTPARRTAAINILATSHALEKAQRYGYLWLDMEKRGSEYEKWARLAVIPNVETWSKRALNIVKYYATDIVELTKDDESKIDVQVPESMSRLVNAESLQRLTLL